MHDNDRLSRSHFLRRLFCLNLFFLFLMTALRLLMALQSVPSGEMAGLHGALLRGMLLDLVPVSVMLALGPAWLLALRDPRRDDAARICSFHAGYYLLTALVLWADFWYFYYFGTHIDPLAFVMLEHDLMRLALMIAGVYSVPLLLLTLAAAGGIVYAACALTLPKGAEGDESDRSRLPAAPLDTALLGLCAVALIVSGVTVARVRQQSPGFGPVRGMQAVGLNGVTALAEACSNVLGKGTSRLNDIPAGLDGETRFKQLFVHRTPVNRAVQKRQPDVVVILMEGWETKLLLSSRDGFDLMAGLREHFDKDLVWYNFYPASDFTLMSLGSVMENRFWRGGDDMPGEGDNARWSTGAAIPYESAGYDTVCIETREIWENYERLGFRRYVSLNDPDRDDIFDAAWRELAAPRKKPLFLVFYVGWNHEPFLHRIPQGVRLAPLTIPENILKQSIHPVTEKAVRLFQYTNHRLAWFLSRVKGPATRDHTIVAITGDHPSRILRINSKDRSLMDTRVPLYVYVPSRLRPPGIDTAVYGSHIDVMPTLYRLSLSNAPYIAAGQDLCDPLVPHAAILQRYGKVITGDGTVECLPSTAPGSDAERRLLDRFNDLLRFSFEDERFKL